MVSCSVFKTLFVIFSSCYCLLHLICKNIYYQYILVLESPRKVPRNRLSWRNFTSIPFVREVRQLNTKRKNIKDPFLKVTWDFWPNSCKKAVKKSIPSLTLRSHDTFRSRYFFHYTVISWNRFLSFFGVHGVSVHGSKSVFLSYDFDKIVFLTWECHTAQGFLRYSSCCKLHEAVNSFFSRPLQFVTSVICCVC